MEVAAKAALFVGIVLLLGAGVFARWIAPELGSEAARRRIRAGAWVGAVLLVWGSIPEVADTISRATGSFDWSLVLPYVRETRHGNAVLARAMIVALHVWLGTAPRRHALADGAAFTALGLALLTTFSLVSHAGAQQGFLPFIADLAHLSGVAAWAGAIAYGAWILLWSAPDTAAPSFESAARRLSTIGLWCVTLISATGVYASLKNIWGPQALTGTPYGRALLVKLTVVSVVAAIAAVNRWVLLPSLTRGAPAGGLGRLLKVESLLLLAVLGVTAVLVTQEPPRRAPTLSRPFAFNETAGPLMLRGTLERRDPGRFALELDVHDATGAVSSVGVALDLTLIMLEHEMTPVKTVLTEVRPGTYRGMFFLPMTGRWQMTVQAGPYKAQIPVQTEDAVFIQPLRPWRVMLPGVALFVVGVGVVARSLCRLGAGKRGWRLPMGAGTALVIIGIVLAVRAAS